MDILLVTIGTLVSVLYAWGYSKLDYMFDRSEIARFLRKLIWQKSTDSLNMKTYQLIINDYKQAIHAETIDQPFISNFLNYLNPKSKILDYGCGGGTLTANLNQQGYSCVGSDISNDFLSVAKETYPNIEYLNADSEKLVKEGFICDGIIAAYSLIHLQKIMIGHVLADFRKLMPKGGYLYLALQCDSSDTLCIGSEGKFPVPYRPELALFLNLFSDDEIRIGLNLEGFEVVEIQHRNPVENEFPFRKMFVIAKCV